MNEHTLAARFGSLPFDTTRVRRHIDAGRVRIGDYLFALETYMRLRHVCRPGGRGTLDRGDAEAYVCRRGNKAAAWEVVAIDRASCDLIVEVVVDDLGPRPGRPRNVSVLWNSQKGGPPDCVTPASDHDFLVELFAPIPPRPETYLDLWDWNVGQAFHVDALGGEVTVHHHATPGVWEVSTPAASLVWHPDIRKLETASGGVPPPAVTHALLVKSSP